MTASRLRAAVRHPWGPSNPPATPPLPGIFGTHVIPPLPRHSRTHPRHPALTHIIPSLPCHSRVGGNLDAPTSFPHAPTSFPHAPTPSHPCHVIPARTHVIPARTHAIPPLPRHSRLPPRHSRVGGNLDSPPANHSANAPSDLAGAGVFR